jgi:hypothetical protein
LRRTITIPKLQWVVAAQLLLATMLNYIDWLTISVAITDLRKQFCLSEQDYSQNYQLVSGGVCHHVRPVRLHREPARNT